MLKKKKYKKKNEFKFNIIFNNNGETLENIIESAFENYCKKEINKFLKKYDK